MSQVMAQQIGMVQETLYCMEREQHEDFLPVVMEHTGVELKERGFPPMFVHKCSECGRVETMVGYVYPRVVEVPVGEAYLVQDE